VANRYQIYSRPRLDADGVHGAWLFMLSPILNGLSWWWYFGQPGMWPLIAIVGTAIAFLGGFILLLIGRDYDSKVDEIGGS
jgi:hypothetical protein